jgi:hypothetical protein
MPGGRERVMPSVERPIPLRVRRLRSRVFCVSEESVGTAKASTLRNMSAERWLNILNAQSVESLPIKPDKLIVSKGSAI